MAEYTKVFDNPYPDGWEDLPSENTPITADALQEHTDAIENIEQYLEDNPIEQGGTNVEWNQIQQSGTKIAEITIGEDTTNVYAPTGSGGSTSIEYGDETAYNEWLSTAQDGEIFVRTDDNEGGGSGSGGQIYDGTERVIGTWFGQTLYRQCFLYSGSTINLPSNTWTSTWVNKSNINIKSGYIVLTSTTYPLIFDSLDTNPIKIMQTRNATPQIASGSVLVIEFTKVGD